jgi:hypothetical protein
VTTEEIYMVIRTGEIPKPACNGSGLDLSAHCIVAPPQKRKEKACDENDIIELRPVPLNSQHRRCLLYLDLLPNVTVQIKRLEYTELRKDAAKMLREVLPCDDLIRTTLSLKLEVDIRGYLRKSC